MLTRAENELLCRVGAETPMGGMLRRYWLPALLSEVASTTSTFGTLRIGARNPSRIRATSPLWE